MTKRIPLNALQEALYTILTAYQTTPVYDAVPCDAVMPYITFGAFNCKPDGAKRTDISNVTMQIDIWSDYSGKAEVNGIAEDIIAVIGHYPIDLSANKYNAMSQEYDMFESFPSDENGYHGVITFVAKIQNIGA